jgi:heterotetrameric sarcosine oxidase gamma subunit
VSALDFLSPDLAGAGLPARSPLAHEALAAGARVEVRDGWEVVSGYGERALELRALGESVAFVASSQLGVIELQGPQPPLEELPMLPRVGEPAIRADEAWWYRMTPTRALVVCEAPATAKLRRALDSATVWSTLDVTAAHAKLTLAGPLAREALARFCALDLRPGVVPVGGFRPGSIARTPGAVLREADARYLLLFGAAYAGYVWSVVADAVARLGGRPAGLDALAEAAPLQGGSPFTTGEEPGDA